MVRPSQPRPAKVLTREQVAVRAPAANKNMKLVVVSKTTPTLQSRPQSRPQTPTSASRSLPSTTRPVQQMTTPRAFPMTPNAQPKPPMSRPPPPQVRPSALHTQTRPSSSILPPSSVPTSRVHPPATPRPSAHHTQTRPSSSNHPPSSVPTSRVHPPATPRPAAPLCTPRAFPMTTVGPPIPSGVRPIGKKASVKLAMKKLADEKAVRKSSTGKDRQGITKNKDQTVVPNATPQFAVVKARKRAPLKQAPVVSRPPKVLRTKLSRVVRRRKRVMNMKPMKKKQLPKKSKRLRSDTVGHVFRWTVANFFRMFAALNPTAYNAVLPFWTDGTINFLLWLSVFIFWSVVQILSHPTRIYWDEGDEWRQTTESLLSSAQLRRLEFD